ncbi:cellulase N-terminal Ig-like domain-containing protein [Algoriphagus aquatilis]|uniref:Cellulase N-terminal Ig-like domain-containing protein n=1 Tax=Algoriphagus aquatilis TaxID=490186 RepID=A0ABW0BZ50_9BACT
MIRSLCTLVLFFIAISSYSQEIFFSVNQVGFHPADPKKAIVFSKEKIKNNIHLIHLPDSSSAARIKPEQVESGVWGDYFYYSVDFTQIEEEGTYFLWHSASRSSSEKFEIGSNSYAGIQ